MNAQKPKYDLEERAHQFGRRVRDFVQTIPKTISNMEDAKQVINSSGLVGANYIEANESLGKKDFLMHVRISRKEAKESRHWLRLLRIPEGTPADSVRNALAQEAEELKLIFSAIIRNSGGER
jgi:four helix bundle protein